MWAGLLLILLKLLVRIPALYAEPKKGETAAVVDPVDSHRHLHRGELLSRLE